jgi:hypothetical protein
MNIDLYFLGFLIALAPLIAAQAHPIPLGLLLVASSVLTWLLCRTVSGTLKWLLGIPLLLASVWVGSIMIIFVLKLPGFAPH